VSPEPFGCVPPPLRVSIDAPHSPARAKEKVEGKELLFNGREWDEKKAYSHFPFCEQRKDLSLVEKAGQVG